MVATAAAYDEGPISFRYPRGEGTGVPIPEDLKPLAIGKGRIMREGNRIALLSIGTRLADCLKVSDILTAQGMPITVADARYVKPLDQELIARLAKEHDILITVEEGCVGGFGTQVFTFLANHGYLDHGLKCRMMTLPDRMIDHNSQPAQLAEAGLDADGILATILPFLDDAALTATIKQNG
jgi:1-deoxy-D-xylulose-5-phosphate synthase